MTVKTLGKKHQCPKCGVRFYDLGVEPVVCPKCGHRLKVKSARVQVASSKIPKAKTFLAHEHEEFLPELGDAVDVQSLDELEEEVEDVGHLEEVEEHHEESDINPNGDDAEDEMYLDGGLNDALLDDVETYLDEQEEDEDEAE